MLLGFYALHPGRFQRPSLCENRTGFPLAKFFRTRHWRSILAILIIIVATTGFLTAAYTFHWFGLGTTSCWSRPTNVPPSSAYFVVVMASKGMSSGFNGSRFHSGPWPIMNVTKGQSVWIHIVSNDTIQSHGFAIVTYFTRGLTLGPGECNDVTFTANQLGSFRVYCYVICTVHPSMQNGEVNVNP